MQTVTSHSYLWTYSNKSPVPKVVDGAEEPELVKEKIRPCDSALI